MLKKKWMDYIIVYIGCIIQAFSITCILKPNGLTVGGITGLSLTLGKIFNFNYTYIYYSICLLILVCAKIFLGTREVKKIVLLSTTYPLILIGMNQIKFNFLSDTPEKLLICIYYGIFMGIGTGLVLKKGFSQGSSDTVAKILHKKLFPFMGISQVLLGLDITILLISGVVFGKTAVLYAIIMQMIYSKTISTVLFGFGSSLVKVVIISDQIVKISNFMKNTIHRGFSIGTVVGGQNKVKREKIISVCSLREAMLIKEFITKIDENAFVNIVPTIAAWGREDGLQKLKEN
ncbi:MULTISPECIES: YitT family protein [Fusobacterium]|uniref:YitT family protein n=1 Tax=Fusobacterium TaxID=848 RepID=UPI001F0ECAD3|nr:MULTISPECIES: YitT family protein [Fusobacterium]